MLDTKTMCRELEMALLDIKNVITYLEEELSNIKNGCCKYEKGNSEYHKRVAELTAQLLKAYEAKVKILEKLYNI